MTSRDFVYWLQGLYELQKPKKLNEEQTELIRRHLALVFAHEIDPSYGPVEKQKVLNEIHKDQPDKSSPPKGGSGVGWPTLYRC